MAEDFIPYQAEGSAPDFIPYAAEPKDPLSEKTQTAAIAAGASTAPEPLPAEMRPVPETYDSSGNPVKVPANINQAFDTQAARETRLGAAENRASRSPTPMTNAVQVLAPIQAARSIVGGKLGAYTGSKVAPYFKASPESGELAGGILGGLLGGAEEAPARTPEVEANAAPTPPTPASAPVAGPPPPAAPLSNRQIGSRIEQGVKEAAGTTPGQPIYPRAARGTVGAQTVGEQPSIEIAGPRIQTPSRNETLTEAMKNRVPGSNPLEAKMPLEEQPISPARTPAQPAEETVHPMDRQFIHVNGSRLLEQIADKPGLRDPLLDLEGNQLREVLRKSGEDMTQIQSVGKSAGKAARGGTISDPTNLTRQEAFDRLLDKGYTPEQILKEAGQRSKPAATRVPFGPPRTTNATK